MSSKQDTAATNSVASSSSKTSSPDTDLTPTPTSSDSPQRTPTSQNSQFNIAIAMNEAKLEPSREEQKKEEVEEGEPSAGAIDSSKKESVESAAQKVKKKTCTKDHNKPRKGKKVTKKAAKEEESSDSSSDESSESSSDSDASSDDSSEEDKKSRKKKAKRKALKKKKAAAAAAAKKHKKSRCESSEDESESESSESSSSEEESRRKRRKKKSRKVQSEESEVEETPEEAEVAEEEAVETEANVGVNEQLAALLQALALGGRRTAALVGQPAAQATVRETKKRSKRGEKHSKEKKSKKPKKGTTIDFKRVNHVWDTNIHNWKIVEEVEEEVDEFDEYAFTVRRKFDWDNHYTRTVVDIKSKQLKEALMEVMKDVQGETLEADEPSVDPNMLFLYLEDLRTHYKKTLRTRMKKEKKRRNKRKLKELISHVKILVRYLDEDYEETKKTLYPLLKAGNITFDLLWALFKPNTIAYTSTYGDHDNPRCFKVDRATKENSFIKGEWYCIEGRYLEYDGKNFGLGEFEVNVEAFKGSRKITSLATYPLKYHKDPEGITKQLINRGKQFVTMTGQNYRFMKGLAFQKKRKGVAKFNINGRVMIDPSTFRRINANYPISLIKAKEDDDENESDSDGDGCGCGHSHSDDDDNDNPLRMGTEEKESLQKTTFKLIQDDKKKWHVVEVPVDEDGREIRTEKLDTLATDADAKSRIFTEEELLVASPVVLGFAFSEKSWLEFSLSGIKEIEWNDEAFQSLVLPKNQKHVVKALVSAHKFHAAETIDDVVQGKGRGLVFVLHGPPGVGKTLTAEGVAEDLRVPLYAVSMGELGTDSNRLEAMLQQVMDIAHSWGAVLLLDEADVFLEKRQHQDVHRNALVSIFLRLLEYFQGILFLTTNRVETFDEAFQSRIHVALKYEELTPAAMKKVWKEFIEKVRLKEGIDVMPFKEADYDYLARKKLNGRQIKNAVRTSQALALHEESKLSMEHIKRVLEVAESFDRDLRGGTGYLDAMRSYT